MSTEAMELIEINFDNLENKLSGALKKTSLGIFIQEGGSKRLTLQGKVQQHMKHLPPINIYMGWDGEIYPKFKVIKRKVIGEIT